eukprot:Skav209793  [mRNA]  locus=scaffold1201:188276:189215:+ [translate_table: standard]
MAKTPRGLQIERDWIQRHIRDVPCWNLVDGSHKGACIKDSCRQDFRIVLQHHSHLHGTQQQSSAFHRRFQAPLVLPSPDP